MRKNQLSSLLLLLLAIFTLSCDREVSISGPQKFETGIAEYFISSEPQGARIYYDNKFTGKITPDTVKWVSKGEHKFTLELFPFYDYSFKQVIDDSTYFTKNYDFYSNPLNRGSIKFISNPKGCEVYLDDNLTKFKTPFILDDIKIGNHKILYSYPQHRSDSLSVFVYPQKQILAELTLIDTTHWVTYNTENSDIADNTITDIYIDDNNIFWIGTAHKGIIKIINGRKEFINEDNSEITSNIIHRIKEDDQNNIWIGTYKGITKISGSDIIGFTSDNSGLPNNYIRDFDFDKEGNIWIGTEFGLSRFDGVHWLNFNTENSTIPENFITAVLIDNNNVIWIGTNEFNTHSFDGVSRWTKYQTDDNPIGDSVSDLIIGPDNTLWVGLITEFSNPSLADKPGGVYRLEDDSFVEYGLNLENNSVHRFYLDDDNELWIGTKSGVIRIYPNYSSKLYNAVSSGLPVDDVLAVGKDKEGNMWFGTNGAGLVQQKHSMLTK